MRLDQTFALDGGSRASIIGKVLSRGISGGAIIWEGCIGALCAYGAEVIGRQIRFSTADHKYKGKKAEVRFMAAGNIKKVLQEAGTQELMTYVDSRKLKVVKLVALQRFG